MKPHLFVFLYVGVLTVSLFQTACAPVSINDGDAHIRGNISTTQARNLPSSHSQGSVRYAELQSLADRNEQALRWYREKELPLYPRGSTSNDFPRTCLALSGGGIRAAAYSIGAMKGFNENELLKEMAIISSVSGGSYALSWFYTQNSSRNMDTPPQLNNVNKIFTESRFIEHLAQNADLYSAYDFVQSAIANTALIPLHWVANATFRWNWNTKPARANYEYEIRERFQSRMELELNSAEGWIRDYNLPYFIINTTAKIDDDRFHHAGQLSNAVFEFTPLRFGSDAFGYRNKDPQIDFPVTFSEAVSISGAAADSSVVAGTSQKFLLSALNNDLGFYMENYSPESQIQKKWWTKFLPFPFYYFLSSSALNGKNGTDIYLSDGGHSENLGAFSLIRRGCETIYIVDAEYDPDYQFEAYFKLKDALKNEMGVELSVPEIDKIKKDFMCSGDKDADGNCEDDDDFIRRNSTEFDRGSPVVEGSIVGFPIYSKDKLKIIEKRPTVVYIKLSIDEKHLDTLVNDQNLNRKKAEDRYGKSAVDYYINSMQGDCGNLFNKCAFPQFSTMDQSYTPEQFKAYVDLGYHNVINNIK